MSIGQKRVGYLIPSTGTRQAVAAIKYRDERLCGLAQVTGKDVGLVDQLEDRAAFSSSPAHQVDRLHQVRGCVYTGRDGAVAGLLPHLCPLTGHIQKGAADRLDVALAALEQVGNDVRIAIGGSQKTGLDPAPTFLGQHAVAIHHGAAVALACHVAHEAADELTVGCTLDVATTV